MTGGSELAPAVAIDTFQRLYDAGQQEPGHSALCTDRRWRRTSARVPAGILATGILDYADEIEAVVRVRIHRFALYDAIGLKRPKNSMNERTRGIELTRLLQARNDRPVAYASNQP